MRCKCSGGTVSWPVGARSLIIISTRREFQDRGATWWLRSAERRSEGFLILGGNPKRKDARKKSVKPRRRSRFGQQGGDMLRALRVRNSWIHEASVQSVMGLVIWLMMIALVQPGWSP